jgi:hypothetical protein
MVEESTDATIVQDGNESCWSSRSFKLYVGIYKRKKENNRRVGVKTFRGLKSSSGRSLSRVVGVTIVNALRLRGIEARVHEVGRVVT